MAAIMDRRLDWEEQEEEYDKYDALVKEALMRSNKNKNSVERVPYSDVLRLSVNNVESSSDTIPDDDDDTHNNNIINTTTTKTTIRVARILAMMPESRNGQADDIRHTIDAFLAIRDFNRRKSIFPNSTLEDDTKDCDLFLRVSFRDTGRSPFQVAKEWSNAFFHGDEDNEEQLPLAVVGPAASGCSAMAATLATVTSNDPQNNDDAGVVSVSGGSTASYLDDKERYPWFARTSTTDSQGIAQTLLQYYYELGGPNNNNHQSSRRRRRHRFAILTVGDNELALDVVQKILSKAKSDPLFSESFRGGADIVVVSYVEGDTQSMKDATNLLKSLGFVYHVGILLSETMILQLYDVGLLGPSSDDEAAVNNTTTTKPKPAWTFYGFITTSYMSRQTLTTSSSSSSSAQNNNNNNGRRRIIDLHRALHRSTYISTGSTSWAKEITQTNRAIFDRYHKLFQNDQKAVDYVWQQHNGQGVFGKNYQLYQKTLNESIGSTKERWYTYDAILAIGIAACKSPSFKTSVLYDTLKNLEFRGASFQSVAFNKTTGTRLPDHVSYDIYNLQHHQFGNEDRTVTEVVRHHALSFEYSSNSSWLRATTVTPLIYPDGSTISPPSIPPVEEDMSLVAVEVRAICWSIAAVVIATSLFFGLWIIRYGRTRIKLIASQPIFLFLLCVGTFLMGCSIVPLTFQEPMPQTLLDMGCMVQIWLLSIGFSTTFAVLFAKTWRITRVVQSALLFRRNSVGAHQVTWVPALVFALNVSLLLIWTVVDPLQWNRDVLEEDAFGQTVKSQGTCHSFDSIVSPLMGSLLIFVNFGAFSVAGYQAYRARELPSSLNESVPITVVIYTILEAFLLGIPLLSVLEVHPAAFMVVATWIIAIVAMVVLIALVGRKIINNNPDENPLAPKSLRPSNSSFGRTTEEKRSKVRSLVNSAAHSANSL